MRVINEPVRYHFYPCRIVDILTFWFFPLLRKMFYFIGLNSEDKILDLAIGNPPSGYSGKFSLYLPLKERFERKRTLN